MDESMRGFRDSQRKLSQLKPKLMVASRSGEDLAEIRTAYEIERFRLRLYRDAVKRGDRVRSDDFYIGVAGVLDEFSGGHFESLVISSWLHGLPEKNKEFILDYVKTVTAELATEIAEETDGE